ncbi:response regulator [Candidatus Halobeggiatoa sp. HSG11]|nr:response regulator [Candidatus Halobeggiatoa sp. HSG11]
MKKLLIISYSIIIVGIIILGIFGILLNQNNNDLFKKQEQRYQSHLLASQLRQSSDDLTRMARTYVITGDEKYEKIYWDILAIRNGEKQRPENYDRIYWDLVLNYGDKIRPDGEAIPLQTLMQQAGFTKAEFAKLQIAQNNSDNLVKAETIAMNAIKGLYDDGNGNYLKQEEPNYEMARKIMHDADYHKYKAKIMQPIDEFLQLLDERTRKDIVENAKISNSLIIEIEILVGLLIFISLITSIFITKHILKQVGGEPAEIAKITEQVAAGNLDIQTRTATGIYSAIQLMIENLKAINYEKEQQDWIKNGQTQLNELITGEQNVVILTKNIITFLCEYVNSQVGLFYLLKKDESKPYLQIISSYAYIENNERPNKYLLGEGLVGQVALNKKILAFNQTAEECPAIIRSGLANAMPYHLLLLPCLYENSVKGIIEIGTSKKLSDIQRNFLEQVVSNIAIAINTANSRTQMQALLKQSQQQSEELQVKQREMLETNEELQNQSEELQTQQEELRESNEALEERTQDLEQQKVAIQDKNQILETTKLKMEKAQKAIALKAEELELASKYKSEFLANMSHELRTPLNSLLILSQLLTENKTGNLDSKQVEYAQTINSAGNDLLTLINDILDLSKVEAGKIEVQWETISLNTLLTSIERKFTAIANDKGVKFTIKIADDIAPNLLTDGQRVKQIINNLLSNALKFTSEGEVKLIVQHPIEFPANIDNLELSKTIAISVIDSGIGIPQDKQQSIFEAFQQADGSTSRSYGGTGLGLSISRQLARLLGGELTLVSEPEKGSTFTLYLPIKKLSATKLVEKPFVQIDSPAEPPLLTQEYQSPKEILQSDDRDNLSSNDKTILVVEDDRKFSNILKDLSKDKGFKCLLAEDGLTGLELAEKHKPNVIILDITLPKMDGLTVMRKLKDKLSTRHIPVHFVSAADQSMDAKKLGAIGYLIKPANIEKLNEIFQKIETFLAKTMKKLLVIADNEANQQKIMNLVANDDLQIEISFTCEDACKKLLEITYDCVILDINIEQNTGSELLKKMYQEKVPFCKIPIVIYADRDLTEEEQALLLQCSKEFPIKSAGSPENLVDEANLFLHQIAANLPDDKRKMLHMVHDKKTVLKHKKVLVVDDDERNIFALATILENNDAEVVCAVNGKESLELLESNPDIAIVLMDIMMPEMDGYEAMREIRKQPKYRNLPIIALTAKAMKNDRNQCIEAGANDYLTKPVDTDKLLSLMRVWLYR